MNANHAHQNPKLSSSYKCYRWITVTWLNKWANNWQDWLSGKNYKSPFGPSLITINARNHIQYLLTRSTNCYFQQNIFSYSKITAVYFFKIYFCLFFLVFHVRGFIDRCLTTHTDFSKLSPSLSMLLFLLTFNSENCTYRQWNDPQSGNEPQMEAKMIPISRWAPFLFFPRRPRKDPQVILGITTETGDFGRCKIHEFP